MNADQLTTIIQSFVMPSRRGRLLDLLASRRRYADFLDALLHDPRYLDPQTICVLPRGEKTAACVLARLRGLGAGSTAYLVGFCGGLEDGTVGDLGDLLTACVGSMEDALGYSADANAAYYERHEGFGYILTAAPNKRINRSARSRLGQ